MLLHQLKQRDGQCLSLLTNIGQLYWSLCFYSRYCSYRQVCTFLLQNIRITW